jgi:hypothetical protein
MKKFQQWWQNPVFTNRNMGAISANEVSVAHPPMRRIVLAASAVVMLIGLNWSLPVYGQTNTIWNGGSSNWNNAANWSGGLVPINGNPGGTTWNVFIDNGNAGNSTTLLDINSTINQLHISTGDVLNIGESSSLGIVGEVLNNSGTININSGGPFASGILMSGSVSLSGGGTIRLSGSNAVIDGEGGTLTNVDNTISGTGYLGGRAVIINQGTIQAGAGENLTILFDTGAGFPVGFTNAGTVRATGGGIVSLNGFDGTDFHGSGNHIYLAEESSRIDLGTNARMVNARFATTGNGVIRLVAGNNADWVDVINTGNFELLDQGGMQLFNSLVNSGSMRILSGGNATELWVNALVNLSGGGTISLSGGNARIGSLHNDGRLTNVDNTISGTGNLGAGQLAIINQGTVQARTGENLTIDPVNLGSTNIAFNNFGTVRADGGLITLTGSGGGEFAGNGLFEARNGGTLQFDGSAVVQNLSGGVLNSGTWRAGNGGGTIRFLNDATSSVTTIGTDTVVELIGTDSQFYTQSVDIPLDNTLNNVQGEFAIRNGRSFATAGALDITGIVRIDGSATNFQVNGELSGTGEVVLFGQSTFDLNGTTNSFGGVLAGNGTITGNLALSAMIGPATLDPGLSNYEGLSQGRLDFADDLTLGNGVRVLFELGANSANSDFITVDNLLKSGSGPLTFEFYDNGWIAGQTYDLIDFGMTNFILSDFSYLAQSSPFQGDFLFSGTLLQFQLNAVPEPSTIGFLTMTGLLMGLRRGRSGK